MHIFIERPPCTLQLKVSSYNGIEYLQLISCCDKEIRIASIRVSEVLHASVEEIRACLVANEIPGEWAESVAGVVRV